MHAPVVRTILAFCLCAAFSRSASAQDIGRTNEQRARFLLTQLEQQLNKIRNYRCQKMTPQYILPGTENQRLTGYRYIQLASDRRGRGRTRTAAGNVIDTQIWDGVKTIEHRQEVDPNGTITHTVFAARGRYYQTQQQDEPWVYLGRDLANRLRTALDSGRRVRVTRTGAGPFRVDMRDETGAFQTTLLDPEQGYAPVYRRVSVNGDVQSAETTSFEEIREGLWFPVSVQSDVDTTEERSPETSTLKCRFTDIVINDDWRFERILQVGFAEGTAVRDRATGRVYVVGEDPLDFLERPAVMDANDAAPQTAGSDAPWRAAFEAAYRLEDGQVLRCIAPPFVPERANYLQSVGVVDQAGRAGPDLFYHFVWDDELQAHHRLDQARLLSLETIIERVVGLASYEYEGTSHLLRLRLTGDWVVRKDATTEQLLAALEQIVKRQTQWSIGFVEHQVDTIVIRGSGAYRLAGRPLIPGDDAIHLYAGDWNAQRDARNAGRDCGTVAGLLDHLADRVGMPIVDATQSSSAELCWSTHESSRLRDQRDASSLYNTRLASLLNNLTRQTGLIFTMELGTVSRWQVATQRGLTARSD